MKHNVIKAQGLPPAVGPYNHAMEVNGLIFTSGQIPVDAETGETIKDVSKATTYVLENLVKAVQAGGGDKDSILQMQVFVADFNDFQEINKAYAEFFGDHKPARYLVEVSFLPAECCLEAACTAYKK